MPKLIIKTLNWNPSALPTLLAECGIDGLPDKVLAELHLVRVIIPDDADLNELAEKFRQHPEVMRVELEQRIVPAELFHSTPTDELQHTVNTGLHRIGAYSAWKHTKGNPAIRVCIADTGWRPHTEFPDTPDPSLTWSTYLETTDAYDYPNEQHGNKIRGIMAAPHNQGGMPGIAPDCTYVIMSYRIDDSGWASLDLLEMIVLGTKPIAEGGFGCKIVNCSFSETPAHVVYTGTVDPVAFYVEGIQYANNQGSLVLAAAGNNGKNLDTEQDVGPAETVGAICIGATAGEQDLNGYFDYPASYSNYGNRINLVAPGCWQTFLGTDGYAKGQGTSFSAPTVAAVAALVWSLNPGLTREQVLDILYTTTDKGRYLDDGVAYAARFPNAGVVHAGKAILKAKATLSANTGQVYPYILFNRGYAYRTGMEFIGGVPPIINLYAPSFSSVTVAMDMGGYSDTPVKMVELWLGDTIIFAGAPQEIKAFALNTGTLKTVRVKARTAGGVGEVSYDTDVRVSSMELNTATASLIACVEGDTLKGSRVPGQSVSVDGYAATLSTDYTWELPIASVGGLEVGIHEFMVVSGGLSTSVSANVSVSTEPSPIFGAGGFNVSLKGAGGAVYPFHIKQ